MDALYQVEDFVFLVWWVFWSGRDFDFVKCFFCIYWGSRNHGAFVQTLFWALQVALFSYEDVKLVQSLLPEECVTGYFGAWLRSWIWSVELSHASIWLLKVKPRWRTLSAGYPQPEGDLALGYYSVSCRKQCLTEHLFRFTGYHVPQVA